MKNVGRRTAIGAALAGAATIASAKTALAYANQFMRDAVPGNRVRFSGCVVRFSNADGSPTIHANAAHMSAGVQKVGINSDGELVVTQSVRGATANPVIFAFAQPDETLSSRGIIAGASGGTDETRFRFYDTKLGRPLNLRNAGDRMRLQGKNSNIWLGWVHTTW